MESYKEKDKYNHQHRDAPRFKNLRLKAETFEAIAEYAFDNNLNLARCVDDAMHEYMERNGIVEEVVA